jgi:large subunit ribosomal protein L29
MRAKDLRERTDEDLRSLQDTLGRELFSYRMKNATNQLEDTSVLRKARQDLARTKLILHERALGHQPGTDKPASEKGIDS